MPRNLVKVGFCHKRGLGKQPAAALFLILDKALKKLDYSCAVRKHNGQSLSDNVNGGEYAEFSAEFVVVAFFCLFKACEMFFKFGRFRKRNAVNALKHLILCVAPPIRARAVGQFYRLYLFQVVKVRSCAEIDKIALSVKTYLFALRQFVYKFLLIRLVRFEFQCFILGKCEAFEGIALFDYLFHLRLDVRKNFGRERSL